MKVGIFFRKKSIKNFNRISFFLNLFPLKECLEIEIYYFSSEIEKEMASLNIHFKSIQYTHCMIEDDFAPSELFLSGLQKIYKRDRLDILIFTDEDKELGVRLSERIKAKCLTGCENIEIENNQYVITRSVYNAHAYGRYTINNFPLVLTVSKTGSMSKSDLKVSITDRIDFKDLTKDYEYIKERKLFQKQHNTNFEEAEFAFVAGLGIRSKKNYERLKIVAKKWGAVCGCTRPVALNGWASASEIIGQSGHVLNAELCIVIGASGAAPFLVGVSNVENLIAVNIDDQARIFDYSNYAIIGNAEDLLNLLEDYHKEENIEN